MPSYVSGPAAATEPRRLALEQIADARRIVLVEGVTDQIVVEAMAARRGVDLRACGAVVAPMGGAHAIDTFLAAIAARDHPPERVGGLCDEREAIVFARALARSGGHVDGAVGGLAELGYFVCVPDLEAELVRAVGLPTVERLIGEQDEERAWRRLRGQAAWVGRRRHEQVHRFLRAKAGRMHRYAPLLVAELEPGREPAPLAGVLDLLSDTPTVSRGG